MPLILIEDLRFGHEADPPLNVRKTGRDEDVKPLAASILAHGLIHPLVVRTIEAVPYVVDGNRRLAAVHYIIENIAPFGPQIECREAELGDALELSLAANVMRLPLHEADRYEAYVDLAAHGLEPARIAERFGVKIETVRRMLALGKLAPAVLQAWREGLFNHDASAIVRAFTVAPSIERQEEVLAKLKADRQLYANLVLSSLGASYGDAQKHYLFVGREAYLEAGGRVTEDLFGHNHVIYEPDIARSLAEQKLEAECAALLAQGWAWAKIASDLPSNWSWIWGKIESGGKATPAEQARLAELQSVLENGLYSDEEEENASEDWDALNNRIAARAFPPDARAKSGCVVDIGRDGELAVTPGVLMPGAVATRSGITQAKNPPAPKSAKDEPETKTISAALTERLSVQLTKAAQAAVVADPQVAIAALLAGALSYSRYFTSPVRLELKGMTSNGDTRTKGGENTFATAFTKLREAAFADVCDIAAKILAVSLDMRSSNPANPSMVKVPAYAALIEAIDPAAWRQAIEANFDCADYLASVPKAFLLAAIGETINPDEARKIASKPVSEIRAFALANVVGTWWLPPELRASHYANPYQPPAKAEAPEAVKKGGTPAKGRKGKQAAPVAEAAE